MSDASADKSSNGQTIVLPLHSEQATFEARARATGTVTVRTVTHLREHIIDEALVEEHVRVEHVSVGTLVDAMPEIRQQGDTTIVPVVEEVLVVERRLFLKQEIHITRSRATARHHEAVMLREQEAVVTRSGATPNRMVNRMASETIVAVFSGLPHAEAAISDLVDAGIPSASIRHYAREDGNATQEPAHSGIDSQHRHGFWAWLTGEENNTDHHALYDRSIESGRIVVTVVTDTEHAEHVHATLERHEPLQLEEHEGAVGSDSRTAPDTTRPAGNPTPLAADSASPMGNPTPPMGNPATNAAMLGNARANFEPRVATPATAHAGTTEAGTTLAGTTLAGSSEEVIPLSEETLDIGKRAVDGGTTRVRRFVVERPVEEQIRLRDETVSVFRRPATGTGAVGADAFRDREVIMHETSEEAVVGKTTRVVEEVVVQKGVRDRVETVHGSVRHDEVEIDGPGGEADASQRNPGSAI